MGKIGAVAQANNAVDANLTLDDLSGWVNVEMPEEETNRVGSKGAERLEKIVSQQQDGDANAPAADSASLVERLYATALRKADGADSSESLRKALKINVNGKIKAEYAELDKCRMAACNAMNDLDSLTGREIASVLDGEEQPNAKATLARVLLNDAVAAQEKYADKLEELANSLPEAKTAQKTALLQLKERALGRANAIKALHKQLRDAAGKVGENDAYDKALLDRRGHTDGIYLKEARQSAGLKALEAGGNVSLDDALGTEALAIAFNDLYGTCGVGNEKVRQREVLGAAAHNIVDGIKLSPALTKAFKACEQVRDDEQAARLMSLFSDGQDDGSGTPADFGKKLRGAFVAFKASLSRYVDVKLGDERADERKVDAATKDLAAKAKELDDQLENLKTQLSTFSKNLVGYNPNGLKDETIAAIAAIDDCKGVGSEWDSRLKDVERLCSIPDGDEKTFVLSEDDRLALMEGTRRLSTVVEAQIWNEDDHHDKELEDAVLIDSRILGKGVFNTVKLCTFAKPDGTTVQRVFRPDSGARRSVSRGTLIRYLSDTADVSGFSYSRAAGKVASVFGCEDVFPRTTFGTLNGEPGMFLEVAPGMTGKFFLDNQRGGVESDPLKDKDGTQAAGEIARKLNRLQWLDCLTGQVDRHMGNIMIGTSGNDVSVKGIDNDECFPDMFLGNGLMVFDSRKQAVEMGVLPPEHTDPQEVDGLLADLSSSPRLKSYLESTPALKDKIVLDMAKMPLKARIKRMESFNNFGFPDHIDKDLYLKLKTMTPEAYEKSLRGQNLKIGQKQAAVARFCLVRDIIDRQGEVEVYEADDWQKLDKLEKANKMSNQLSEEIDEQIREAQKNYEKESDKLTELSNQNPEEKVLARARADFKRFENQHNKDMQALETDKLKISDITSNYYARSGCHQYLGLND